MRWLLLALALWQAASFPSVHGSAYYFNMNQTIMRALDMALDKVDRQMLFEVNLISGGQQASKNSEAFGSALFSAPTAEARIEGRKAYILLAFTDAILEITFLSVNEIDKVDPMQSDILSPFCHITPTCDPIMRFSNIDGSCNNLQHPTWGQANNAQTRLLAPAYVDGLSVPRRSVTGKELPSARLVSAKTVLSQERPRPDYTMWIMQWGQWIEHDLSHVPLRTISDFIAVPCCTENGHFIDPKFMHPHCMPIAIPPDDRIYAQFGRTCMSYLRSMVGPRPGCKLGAAEQLNQVTPILDGSQIYGSSLVSSLELRSFTGGLLQTTRIGNRNFLPLEPDTDHCLTNACFKAGDLRVNYQPQLTATHLLWVREHNRIATALAAINPFWDDDELYFQSRRIVIAELQHITMNHWLPQIIGWDLLDQFGIACRTGDNYCNTYDPNANPSVSNEFGAAAAFFVDNFVQGLIEYYNDQYQLYNITSLSSMFNDPRLLADRKRDFDALIRGLQTQVIQNYDSFATAEITTKLFRGSRTVGMDRIALTIQRGRDHGLRSYNDYREVCQTGRVKSFDELTKDIPAATVETLKQVYETVDDIDLFIGGFVERPLPGTLLGPTFSCILADQFIRTVRGDRFFYWLGNEAHSFTLPQLQQIRKTSLARVICDNNDGTISFIQPDVFKVAVGVNARVSCGQIPGMDLGAWGVPPPPAR